MPTIKPIVVGVDGSPSSKDAATYAAHLAQRRQVPLTLVTVYQWPLFYMDVVGLPVPDGIPEHVVRAGKEPMLQAEVERLKEEFPELVEINARLLAGHPAEVLIGHSATAEATVVGCRGLGGFAELLLGSVSAQVATHGHGPVIVLRSDDGRHADPDGPVLVGYDGSPSADAALEFAAGEAEQRKTSLTVVNVYDDGYAKSEKLLATAAAILGDRYPHLHVELRPQPGLDPAYAMVSATREAALTVVGSRGHGGFAGFLLGSVGGTLIHYGRNPVAVIHPRKAQS